MDDRLGQNGEFTSERGPFCSSVVSPNPNPPHVLLFLQMLSRLLGVLVLTSPSLAMIPSYATGTDSIQEDKTSPDPNTHWIMAGDGEMAPTHHTGPLAMPPLGKHDSRTDRTMFDATSPADLPIPDPTICDWLLNAPVPVPIDQID